MELRKLQKEEHIRTRKLWETIFVEDTSEFLDYYYSVKIQNNEIYVIEDGAKIVSMLHLNPYQMRIEDQVYQSHYIVAVATDENYRKRGLMRRLLNHVMQIMTDRGEPFTFLMPVAEAIYKPFGFEYIYEQRQGKVAGKKDANLFVEFIQVQREHCQIVADYANMMLEPFDIVTYRDEKYYQILLDELASEKGGIFMAMQDGNLKGIFCYTQEKETIFHAPLFCEQAVLQQAIYHITGNETEEVTCTGYGSETKPMIMAKVLNPDLCPNLKKAKVYINEVV